jgi:hypothetical protein
MRHRVGRSAWAVPTKNFIEAQNDQLLAQLEARDERGWPTRRRFSVIVALAEKEGFKNREWLTRGRRPEV